MGTPLNSEIVKKTCDGLPADLASRELRCLSPDQGVLLCEVFTNWVADKSPCSPFMLSDSQHDDQSAGVAPASAFASVLAASKRPETTCLPVFLRDRTSRDVSEPFHALKLTPCTDDDVLFDV